MIHELAMTANQLLRQLQLGKAEKKIAAVVSQLRANSVLLQTPKGDIEIPIRPGQLHQGEKVLIYFNERGNLMLETLDKLPRGLPPLQNLDVWNNSQRSSAKTHVSDKVPELMRDYEALLKKPLDARVLFARVLDVAEIGGKMAGDTAQARGWNAVLEYRGQQFELQTSQPLKPGGFYPFALEKSGEQFYLKKLGDPYRFPPELKDILSRQGREPHTAYRLAWDKLLPLKSEAYFEKALVDFGDVIKNSGILSGYRSGQAVFDPPMGEAASRILDYVFGLNYKQSQKALLGDFPVKADGVPLEERFKSSPDGGAGKLNVSEGKVSKGQVPSSVNTVPSSRFPIPGELLEKILGANIPGIPERDKPADIKNTMSNPSSTPRPLYNEFAGNMAQNAVAAPENPGMYLSQALEKLAVESQSQESKNINWAALLRPNSFEKSLDKLLDLFVSFTGDEKWSHSKAQIWGAMAKFPALSLLFLNQHYQMEQTPKEPSSPQAGKAPGIFVWDLEKPLGPNIHSQNHSPLPINRADSLFQQYQQLSKEEAQAGGVKTEHSLFKFALQGMMSEVGAGENQRGENWVQGYYYQGGEWRGLRFRFEHKHNKAESGQKAKPLSLNIELTTANLDNVWVAARVKPEGLELDLENERGDVSPYMAEEISILEQNLKFLDVKVLRYSSKQRKAPGEDRSNLDGKNKAPFFIKSRKSGRSDPGFDITA